ncbi:MAG: discoidin domain-containing protein [Clostridium sp.]|nr:discoidin domain-containing protein [Clostridium sp.]
MRKTTLLTGILLYAMGAMPGQAQTVYRPVERVSTLQNNTKYFIYNTTFNNQEDRTGFLFDNGSANNLGHSGSPKQKPATFYTFEAKYLWTIESTDEDNIYYIKANSDKYVSQGKPNSDTGVAHTILPWQDATEGKSEARCEAADGSVVENANISVNEAVWIIKDNSITDGKPYWNGNLNNWAKWESAHPYAFYTVESIDASNYYSMKEARKKLTEALNYVTTRRIALITDANEENGQYTSNKKSNAEGTYGALIDGDATTYFHSMYNHGDDQVGTDPHYLQADLGKEVSEFSIYTKKRHNNDLNRPTTIEIAGSNTADGTFTPIVTLTQEKDGLIDNDDYQSYPIKSTTAYRYLRFTVKSTNNGTIFFTYSEFQIYDESQSEYSITAEQAATAKNALYAVQDITFDDILNNHEKIERLTSKNKDLTDAFDQLGDDTFMGIANISNGYYMIYHTDNNGEKHYLQIAPEGANGALNTTANPVYSFNISKCTTANGEAEWGYYLTMNGCRVSHWNGSIFNTNNIETNDTHCEGLWHCQAIFQDAKTGKYAIRNTNAAGTGYNAGYYIIPGENGTLTAVSPTDHKQSDLYQWELRSGYPIDLTTEDSNPIAYSIKSGRTNNGQTWWYTYTDEGKIDLTQFVSNNKQQYWYFKETEESGNFYLRLYPYAGNGKVISYSDTNNGDDKVSGQEVGTEGYDNKWIIETTNLNAPYALRIPNISATRYLSNIYGVGNKLGLWQDGPSDGGTAMYIMPFTTPDIDFWSEYIGTELGKYNVTAPDLTNATTITSYYQAVDDFYATLNTENIVKPTAGFYRFKGKASGNYMDATENVGNMMSMKAESECSNAGSIFYLSDTQKLLSYSEGTYLQETYQVGAIGSDNSNSNTLTFVSPESKNYGYYTIKTNLSSPYLYDNTTKLDRNSGYVANRCDWIIEPVTELPVAIGQAGWSTFCAPVNLVIPEGMTVYYASTEEEREGVVVVKPVTSAILPAGLPVMLSAAQGNYSFTITPYEQDVPAQVNETLKGTEAGKITATTDGSTYVLTVLKSTGNVGFAKNKSGAVPGFKAYLEPGNSNAELFSISFSDNVTGIQSVAREDDKATEYYDLSGRRVYFPTKGIYVTGRGEKVLMK